MNLFIALPLPEALRAELGAMPRPPVTATWARPEGLHLTLAFLGAEPAAGVAPLAEALAASAARHAPFPLRTAGLQGFPALGRARILWLDLEAEPRLLALAQDLRRNLKAAGLAFDAKPFVPHITLARLKAPADLRQAPGLPPRAFEADRLVLFRSHRLPEGARYEAVLEAPLMASSIPEGGP